ncbi:sensor histidine kinase [Nocardia transvalensis]|uniref:sensor histidine kinase n=1 Tax=Nocardia transvalensis TaxID=37333 RepID=UPI00189487F5|nr:HAMP domain-containing sensor histidine kinase [Nocardia transvalensis]MBF6330786.1 HAMP domain-containing histidine kinase [Nocardia transvalensis]
MRWPGGLRSRLLVAFVVATTIGAVLAAAASFVTARAGLVADAQNQAAEGLRERITAIAPELTYPPDQATLERILDVVGDSAEVTYGSLTARTGGDLGLIDTELRTAVRDRGELVLQRVRPSTRSPVLAIGMPLTSTGVDGRRTPSGIEVYALVDLAETQHRIEESAWAAALTSALALPLAAVLALLAARSVLRPVRELRSAAGRFADGDLSVRVRPRGSDELSELARTVNRMAAELEDTMTRLRESEAESRRFVADVSHELRTPLATLTAVVEVLDEDSAQLSPDQQTSARLAVEATRRLTRLVGDLIEVSRFDAASERLQLEEVEVRRAVSDTLRARDWARQVTVDAPDPIDAVLDPRRLDVVVANLVGNALTHGAPPVRVEVRADDEFVTVTVVDGGPGLPADDPNRVFDRFYKGDPSRSRSQGSGLGLAIAREHARLHGGDIIAENVPGGGARFVARFPRRGEEI